MTLVDPIGDMLTRLRNGQMRSLNKINIPFSNFRQKILEVLKKEGYIIDFKIDGDKIKVSVTPANQSTIRPLRNFVIDIDTDASISSALLDFQNTKTTL